MLKTTQIEIPVVFMLLFDILALSQKQNKAEMQQKYFVLQVHEGLSAIF